jgi:hypothetical protein
MRGPKLLFALALLLASSACSIWFLANQDPGGLACAPDPPFCLENYTCVQGFCQRAALGEPGTRCVADGECKEGLVCTNAFEEESCGNDINCELGRAKPSGAARACRQVCNPNAPWRDQCSQGQRCFPDTLGSGWCQDGVCEAPSDCGTNPVNGRVNVCFEASLNPSGSGLCTLSCDPLECNPTSGCPDCPLFDFDGTQQVAGCEPFERVLSNMGCVPAGTVPSGGTCDEATTFCQAGSFCLKDPAAPAGLCSRICRAGGGNPACDAGATCNPIGNTGFGFCA